VPALVYLALLFLLYMVQPVFFMQEKLAAAGAFHRAVLVGVLSVHHKFVIILELGVAFLADMFAKKSHGML
jgi:hypothetical protein